MKVDISVRLDDATHACLKEMARQKGTTMSGLIRTFIFDSELKDSSGKITDGESWIHEYKEKQRRRLW